MMPELPPCAYRGEDRGGRFRCAASGTDVGCDDCLACTIPATIAHKDACLYLLPLRRHGGALYACSWFSKAPTIRVSANWRDICFCPYWFPRGPLEAHIAERARALRERYLARLEARVADASHEDSR